MVIYTTMHENLKGRAADTASPAAAAESAVLLAPCAFVSAISNCRHIAHTLFSTASSTNMLGVSTSPAAAASDQSAVLLHPVLPYQQSAIADSAHTLS
jgi:hypothetical protein